MAVFAIGDVQGCYGDLMRLLERVHFDENDDRLWFAGDLVNRGSDSLDVLRFVNGLGDGAIAVLGNHDLHLLATAAGAAKLRKNDTLDEVLEAADRDELLDWLRRRPMLHHDAALGYTLVHAGLPPQWDLAQAQACAHELERALRGSGDVEFFRQMYGDEPRRWHADLKGTDRLRFIVNCFTRLRYCSGAGDLELKHKGAPGTQPEGCLPWFEVPGRASSGLHLLFGHWSTLGDIRAHNVYPLDTGCVWGGRLTALRLDGDGSDSWYCVDCKGAQSPGSD
ncbi:MAG TPA: symmetrical bis(5'-nucleosyl)-tetraphosphatase [Gammaproteobacteria bacterium]|jgi:bis(5'-nucleosyl)-tetraphosphatase (symmetrical)